MESASQLELLSKRITYDENLYGDETTYQEYLNRLLEDSKFMALSLRFPYQDYSNMELPKKYYNWQLRCCVELKELIGSANIRSYSENGLSWTRDTGNLSTSLVNEIEPMVGYVVGEGNDI